MSLQSIIEILAEEQPVDLIDGLWDRHLTVLCGREYAGKSSLALHAVRALLAGTPLLGRNTDGSEHRVIWLPTDPGGRFEVASRAHQLGIDDVERFQVESHPLRASDASGWEQALERWRTFGATAMVIDNLIGVCDPGAEINSTTGVGPALARIQHICDVAGTSVLLLHHTSKPGPTGRSGRTPVGSFQVGAKARKTLLLDADDRDREHKTLEVTDNNSGGSKTHFWMTPFAWELRERSAKQVRVNRDMDRRRDVAALLLAAPSQARRSSSALGVYLFERGLAPSPEAGRKKVSRLLATHVSALGEDGQIGPGPNAQDLQTGQR